jgi:hypothetical protein
MTKHEQITNELMALLASVKSARKRTDPSGMSDQTAAELASYCEDGEYILRMLSALCVVSEMATLGCMGMSHQPAKDAMELIRQRTTSIWEDGDVMEHVLQLARDVEQRVQFAAVETQGNANPSVLN